MRRYDLSSKANLMSLALTVTLLELTAVSRFYFETPGTVWFYHQTMKRIPHPKRQPLNDNSSQDTNMSRPFLGAHTH